MVLVSGFLVQLGVMVQRISPDFYTSARYFICALFRTSDTKPSLKNPLTYDGCITKKRAIVNITLMWIIPAGISLGPFLGWSDYVYNPAIMVCEQKWDMVTILPLLATTFLVPLGIIVFLNYRVLKVVSRLQSSFKIIPITVEEQPRTGHPAE